MSGAPVPTRGTAVDHDVLDADLLPDASAIAAITLAELAAGPHATSDEEEHVTRVGRGSVLSSLSYRVRARTELPIDSRPPV